MTTRIMKKPGIEASVKGVGSEFQNYPKKVHKIPDPESRRSNSALELECT